MRSIPPARREPFPPRHLAVLLLAACTLAAPQATTIAAAQGAAPGRPPSAPVDKSTTARLRGVVTAADTGRAIPGAIVQIVNTGAKNFNETQGRWTATDAAGRWEFTGQPGRYTVSVSKAGFLTLRFGQRRPFEPGRTVDVAAGQTADKLDVALPRGGIITGRIVDDFGDPVSGAFVHVLRQQYVSGQRTLGPLAEGLQPLLRGGGSITDDLGQYRLHGLAPGTYYVSAEYVPPGDSADRRMFPSSFYPGTNAVAQAERVQVDIGRETSNVNFAVHSSRYATISGTVLDASARPLPASVELVPIPTVRGGRLPVARNTGEGTFTITDVSPGEYRAQVVFRNRSGAAEFAFVPLSVAGEDIAGLTIVTAPAATATGRVTLEESGDSAGGILLATTVVGESTLHIAPTRVNADGTFQATGLVDRRVIRVQSAPEGWFLKAVTHEGRDVTDSGIDFTPGRTVSGIDVLLTRRVPVLTGVVHDSTKRPITDYTVVVFSTDTSKWQFPTRFVTSARSDQDGRFSIRGMPPDDYFVIALEYVETGQEHDPEQLERWKGQAARITLREGDSNATLTLAR